jgi:diguanylate cyclase (GGDEF)-like protein
MISGLAAAGWKAGPRVLVVGDNTLADRIGEIIFDTTQGGTVQIARGWLMAMGQLAADCPTALVGRVEDLDEPYASMAAGIRKLAPALKLYLISSPEREGDAERAIHAGFDGYWLDPVDWQELVSCMVEDDLESAKGVVKAGLPKAVQAQNPSPSERAMSPVVSARTLGHRDLRPPSGTCDKLPGKPSIPARKGSGIDTSDADLIEILIDERHDFCEAALDAIRSVSGIQSVQWAHRISDVPAGHVWVSIGHHEHELGVLHASATITAERLSQWSEWLARWLALEKKFTGYKQMAMRDELTGLWNRRYFNRFLKTTLDTAARDRFRVTLLIFDIDDFKQYNDCYGHAAGDEILREAARLMQSVVRDHDVVARIGGDEFAVIFWDAVSHRSENSEHPQDPLEVAERFQQVIFAHRFPKLGQQAPDRLTISGGLASFPWDGRTPEELINLADRMAMLSKQQGKNAITLGPGVEQDRPRHK